ncbi:MAG TPA: SDR family oxidoreductase [Terriglobia bacterium]|nr:SDR family oxidoreductase [Terriglobia bacterium]
MNDARWAVITGASSGIGRALMFEFAGDGYNVVLTGRNEAALRSAAEECRSRHHVETDIVIADLASAEETRRLILELASHSRRYEALVNNAGFGIHGEFVATDLEREIEMVDVQLVAMLRLTKGLLPAMVARHHGNVLNVASVYAFGPVPSQAVYAASKAFILSFSSALQDELRGSGVHVTAFCPGVTKTEFRARAGIFDKGRGITAEHAARIAYDSMKRGRHVVVPGLANRIFFLLSRLLPSGSFAGVTRWINRQRGLSQSRNG